MLYNSMQLARVEEAWPSMVKHTTNLEKWPQSIKTYILEAFVSGNGPAISVASISNGLFVEIDLSGACLGLILSICCISS